MNPNIDANPSTYPLSHLQRGFWINQQQSPHSTTYNSGFAMRILSELNPMALRQAFQALVDQQDALRAVVYLKDGQPVQQIMDEQTVAFTHVDATDWDEEQLRVKVIETHRLPYDLVQGPIFRVHLFTQAPDRHVLLIGSHHVMMDADSLWYLLKEIAQLYPAFCEGKRPVLPVPEYTYADYVRYEEETLQRRGEKLGTFWQSRLADVSLQLEFPTDYLRPPVQQLHGRSEFFALSGEITAGLNALAKQEKVTLYMLLLASLQILLYRYSQQESLIVGVPSDSRPSAGYEATAGNFINMMPLWADFSENPTVKDFLRQVWKTTMMGLRHQAQPFSLLVQDLNIPHNPAISPVVQAIFNFPQPKPELAPFLITVPGEQESTQAIDWAGLSIAPFGLPQQEGGVDFGLEMVQGVDKLFGVFMYNPDLFSAETMQRIIGNFQTLLSSIIANPAERVANLPLLTEAERHQVLVEWNNTAAAYPDDKCMHELFEAQAARTPDAVAIVYAKKGLYEKTAGVGTSTLNPSCLTYRELNERANQLAHHLRTLGVTPGAVVGVCMERCPETVVSLLGIFKAGGVYVPLDPALPPDRLTYMLTNSEVKAVLTKSQYAGRLAESQAERVYFDRDESLLDAQRTSNPINLSTPQSLAYVIYTSGSTGLPKGAMVEHQGMVNHLYAKVIDLNLTSDDRVAETAPQSFDISIWQFLCGLLVGGAVHIIDDDTVHNPAQLLARTEAEQITILEVVPSLFRPMLDELAVWKQDQSEYLPDFLALRWVLLTGEALPSQLCREWLALYPNIPLMNAYGPTECSDDVTHHVIDVPPPPNAATVPIGRTVINTQLYILDRYMQPVPIGVPGELYVGGVGVGRGYLNDPARTANAFSHDPFIPELMVGDVQVPARFYKTGDLTCYRSDGSIEFLGRLDHQVKIRGFRIELGEIENALLSQDDVHEAVVLAREENGDKRLVAYIVDSGQLTVDSEEDSATCNLQVATLRDSLAQQLPDYMIPSAFVFLDSMPLTPNGKLDRRALPAPDYVDTQSEFVAPHTETEIAISQAFAHVLRVDQVGIHDNFFRMGGDSILSIQVVSRAAQLGYTVSVKDIFQYPTIAELATSIDTVDAASQVIASQETQEGFAPILPIQRWLLESNQPEMHHFNQSFLLTVKQPIRHADLETAIGALLQHHDALRFAYLQDESGWQQQYLKMYRDDDSFIPLTLVDLSAITPAERVAEIERIGAETQASLDPINGDLVRFVYFQMDEDGGNANRLLIVIHHLAVDGVSWHILIEDLTTLLDGGQLPLKSSSYRNWGEMLQTATTNGHFDGAITDWLAAEQMENIAALSLDDPNAANTLGKSHQLSLILPKEQTDHLLRTLTIQHDVTLDAVVLTALTETLTADLEQANLRVKFESYGRQELFETINLNRTVGWFTSGYPLTLPHFEGSAVKRIRYTLDRLRRVTDGGISFGALHDFHPDERVRAQFAALPEAQIVYNYLGQLDGLDNHRFGMAPESAGSSMSATMVRDILLESNAMTIDGQLHIHWTVSPQIDLERAEALLDRFQQQLYKLIAEACASTEYVALPSDKEQGQDGDSWFVTLQQAGSRQPLYCLYPVTGTISQFRNLIPYLSPQQSLYALQARGIYDDLSPFETLEKLASDTICAIKKIQPTGPYHLLGWSFGARLGYEIAQQLQAQGDEIGLLAILDEYPDSPEESHSDIPKESQLANFIYNLALNREIDAQHLAEQCQIMIEQYGDAHIQPLYQKLLDDGYSFPFDASLVERIYNVYRSNMRMFQRYQLKTYAGSVVVFTVESSDSASGIARWANLVSGSVEQVLVQGTHFTLLNPENIESLGNEVKKRLG